MVVGMGQEERRKGKRKEERRRLCSGNGSSKCMELSVPCLASIFNCLESAWLYTVCHYPDYLRPGNNCPDAA
jgi:hypothetical protein